MKANLDLEGKENKAIPKCQGGILSEEPNAISSWSNARPEGAHLFRNAARSAPKIICFFFAF